MIDMMIFLSLCYQGYGRIMRSKFGGFMEDKKQ